MERASSGLWKVMAELLRHAPPGDAPVLAWPLVCGKNVAERTRALSFAAGELLVEVPDRTWRGELAMLVSRYVAIINRLVPDKVERIVFVLPGERA